MHWVCLVLLNAFITLGFVLLNLPTTMSRISPKCVSQNCPHLGMHVFRLFRMDFIHAQIFVVFWGRSPCFLVDTACCLLGTFSANVNECPNTDTSNSHSSFYITKGFCVIGFFVQICTRLEKELTLMDIRSKA